MKFDRSVRTIAVVGFILLIATTGCVSKKKYNRDVNALQAQVTTLSNEVARLDSQTQQRPSFFGSKPTSGSGVSTSVMYRTPSGFEVPAADIQRALKAAGYFDGEIDGEIGSGSREAIRRFQQDNGLHADGVVGKRTWEKLKAHLPSGSSVIK